MVAWPQTRGRWDWPCLLTCCSVDSAWQTVREPFQYKSLPKNASFPEDCGAVEATELQPSKED